MPDIITSSGEMAEVESAKKKVDKNEKEPPLLTENDRVVPGTGNVVNVYPNGLPKNVLEVIDYSKFGAMLKQEQLLPPSYDKKPIKVEIGDWCGYPRVFLTFKSKTSDSFIIENGSEYIYESKSYNVIFEKNESQSILKNKEIKLFIY